MRRFYRPAPIAPRGRIPAYRADDQSLASVCVCDLASVIYGGAALGVYLYQVAKEDLDARRLDAAIVENFSEILNICAGWVSAVVKQHVKFAALYLPEVVQPAEVRTFCKLKSPDMHLQLNITGYGTGRISVLH